MDKEEKEEEKKEEKEEVEKEEVEEKEEEEETIFIRCLSGKNDFYMIRKINYR